MMNPHPSPTRASAAYGGVQRESQVGGASPQELTRLLLENALSRISVARRLIEHGDDAGLRRCIDKTLAVVHELQGSLLDHENNALSAQLHDLYSFVSDQLLQVNLSCDLVALNNAANTLSPLLEAWNGLVQNGVDS